jgi:3-methyladenine DNA glycosylase AlkD
MEKYIATLEAEYHQYIDTEKAEQMSKYMKSRFPFFGIPSKKREEINKVHISKHGLPEYSQAESLAKNLFELPEREFHYFAIFMLSKLKRHWPENSIKLFEKLIITNSWWDSVDYMNNYLIAPYFKQFPHETEIITDKWSLSENIWLKRVSIIFQLLYKDDTDKELLAKHILDNTDSNEFFVQKAIGWALRQYSKFNKEWVLDFVENTELKPLSHREALKWLKNKNLL